MATTLIKLIPIILVSCVGIFHINVSNLEHFNISGHSNLVAIANAAMLTFFAFAGLESATIPADSVKNPEKTIFRATVLGTLITAAIYLLSTVAIMGMFAPEILAKDPAPFSTAGTIMFGGSANKIFALAAIISCFCTITGFLFITSQSALATARDGLLPKFLAKMSTAYTPYLAIIVSSIVMTVLLGMNYSKLLTDQYMTLVSLSNLCILIPYLYSTISALIVFKRSQQTYPTLLLLIALLSCVYILFAMIGSGKEVIFDGIILLFALTPLYAFLVKKKSS